MEIVRASVKFGQARQSGAGERRKCGREKKTWKGVERKAIGMATGMEEVPGDERVPAPNAFTFQRY